MMKRAVALFLKMPEKQRPAVVMAFAGLLVSLTAVASYESPVDIRYSFLHLMRVRGLVG
jgi:hypothetical protein